MGQGQPREARRFGALPDGELRSRLLDADGAPELGNGERGVLAREEADNAHRRYEACRRIRAWSPKNSEKPMAEHWSRQVESNETSSSE